jgi:Tol biopolymer transport system component
MRRIPLVLIILLALTFSAASAEAQSIKISGDLPERAFVDGSFAVTPDGQRAVYITNRHEDDQVQSVLYSVPIDGSAAPLQLSPPDVGNIFKPTISSDSRFVVFTAGTFRDQQLYTVPVDGREAARQIVLPVELGPFRHDDFAISADSRFIVFMPEDYTNAQSIYSAPVDGTQPAKPIATPTRSHWSSSARFEISPDGKQVAYKFGCISATHDEIRVVPVDSSGASSRAAPIIDSCDNVDFYFSSDNRLLYTVWNQNVDRAKLFISTPAAPDTSLLLFDTGDDSGFIGRPRVDPTGRYAVFCTRSSYTYEAALYRVQLAGQQTAMQLTQPDTLLFCEDNISTEAMSSDGALLAFTGKGGLYVVATDGNRPARLVADTRWTRYPAIPRGISADKQFVFYTLVEKGQNYSSPSLSALYSAPLDGSQDIVRLSHPDPILLNPGLAIIEHEGRVIYTTSITDDPAAIYSAPLRGPYTDTIVLSDLLVSGEQVRALQVAQAATDSRLLFVADRNMPYGDGLYSAELDPLAVGFDEFGHTLLEGSEPLTIAVRLSRPTTEPITVSLTLSGTATLGEDYLIDTETLLFPAGESMASITVTPLADGRFDGDEQLRITLQPPPAVALRVVHELPITLVDADAQRVFLPRIGR